MDNFKEFKWNPLDYDKIDNNDKISLNDLDECIFDFEINNYINNDINSPFFAEKMRKTIRAILNINKFYSLCDVYLNKIKNQRNFFSHIKLFEDFVERKKISLFEIFYAIYNYLQSHKKYFPDFSQECESLKNVYQTLDNTKLIKEPSAFFWSFEETKKKIQEFLSKENNSFCFDFEDLNETINKEVYFEWNRIKYKLWKNDKVLIRIGDEV